MSVQIPRRDLELRAWITQFHNAMAGNLTVLGITSAQATALDADQQDFDTKLTDHDSKRVAAIAATSAKNDAKEALIANAAALVRIIRGHPVPTELLDELGIGPISPPSHVQPDTPEFVTVTPTANGTNTLRWQKSGNKRGVTYMIEVNNANTEGWVIVGTTTKRTYAHKNQTLGFLQSYRITAVRAGLVSDPSFPVTVYAPEQAAEVIQLKAA